MGISLRNITKRVGDVFQGAYHQVNPLDGGRTYKTNWQGVQPAPPAAPPAARAPQNTAQGRSGLDIARQNVVSEFTAPNPAPIVGVAKSLWGGIKEAPEQVGKGLAYSVGSGQEGARKSQQQLLDSNNYLTAQAARKINDPRTSDLERERWINFINEQQQRNVDSNYEAAVNNAEFMDATDPKKNLAAIASVGFDVATLGYGTAGYQALKAAGKQGGKQFAKEAARQGVVSGGLAAPSGALSPVIQKGDEATITDMAKGGAVGFGVGAAIPTVAFGGRQLLTHPVETARFLRDNPLPVGMSTKKVGDHTPAEFNAEAFNSTGGLKITNGNSSAMLKKVTAQGPQGDLDVIEIESIVSTKAKTGSATALMNDIKKFAEEQNKAIVLTAVATPKSAYGRLPGTPQSPMSQAALEAWYEKQGFKKIGGNQYAWKGKSTKLPEQPADPMAAFEAKMNDPAYHQRAIGVNQELLANAEKKFSKAEAEQKIMGKGAKKLSSYTAAKRELTQARKDLASTEELAGKYGHGPRAEAAARQQAAAEASAANQAAKKEIKDEAWLAQRQKDMGNEIDEAGERAIAAADISDKIDDLKATAKSMKKNLTKQVDALEKSGPVVQTKSKVQLKAEKKQLEAEIKARQKAVDAELKARAAIRKAGGDPNAKAPVKPDDDAVVNRMMELSDSGDWEKRVAAFDKKNPGMDPLERGKLMRQQLADEMNGAKPKVTAKQKAAPTLQAYGKTIEMTPENGYQAVKAADGGTVYTKTATTGSNIKGDRGPVTSHYDAQGNKLTAAQAKAMVEGQLPSGKPKVAAKAEAKTEYVRRINRDGTTDYIPVEKPKVAAKPDTAKSRGYERAMGDDLIPKDVKKKLKVKEHEIKSQERYQPDADALVASDLKKAEKMYGDLKLRDENTPLHTAIGNALKSHYFRTGQKDKMRAAIDVRTESSSEAGQALRSFRDDPFAVVRAAEKAASKNGKVFAEADVQRFYGEAERIAKIKNKAKKEAALEALRQQTQIQSIGDKVYEATSQILGVPRAIMTSGDISFGLRQGAVLGSRHPVRWVQAIGMGARMAFDPAYSKRVMGELASLTDESGKLKKNGQRGKGQPLAPVFEKMGIDLPAVNGKSEEIYGNTTLAEKIPLVGAIVRASDRAFSGSAAILRAKVTQDFINRMGGVKKLDNAFVTDKHYTDYGRVINTATGRGRGSAHNKVGRGIEKVIPSLSNTLFSARLWKSRLDMLNPVYYATLTGPARREAMQSMGAYTALVGVTLMAAHQAGLDVDTDPRSSDFLKIKVGDTRYDVMGGFQQNIVAGWRIASREYKTVDGRVSSLTDGKGTEWLDVVQNMINNKLAPVPGTALKLIKGTDAGGNPVNPWTEVGKLFLPMGVPEANSQFENAKDRGLSTANAIKETVLKSTPNFVGISTNTFKSKDVTKNKDGSAVNPADLSPEELKKFKFETADKFKESLNDEEKKLYELNGDKDAAVLAVRSGKVKQDQLDDLKVRYNQVKLKAGLPLDYVEVSDDEFNQLDDAGKALITEASLTGSKKFKEDKPSAAAQKVMEGASNGNFKWPADLGEIKTTNKLALEYVKTLRDVSKAPEDDALAYREMRSFWRTAVKDQYGEKLTNVYGDGDANTTNDTQKGYGYSIADIESLMAGKTINGKKYDITKKDIDTLLELDNKLLAAGLVDSPKFSKTFRKTYGYAEPPTTSTDAGGYTKKDRDGSGGSGRGSSTAGLSIGDTTVRQSFGTISVDVPGLPSVGGGAASVKLKQKRRAKVSIKKARA